MIEDPEGVRSSQQGRRSPDRPDSEGHPATDLQDALGRRLRESYGKLVAEPLPDKFRDLLDKLGDAGKKSD